MDIHTTTGNKHHGKRARKAGKKPTTLVRRAQVALRRVERASGVGDLVKGGEQQLTAAARQTTSWIARNPRSAVSIALGAGVFIGVFMNGGFRRAALVGLTTFIGRRFV